MQPTPPPPVTAGAVVEEVGGGWSRWIRPVAAGLASFAVLAASAALWEYGRRAGDDTLFDPHDVLPLALGLHFGAMAWLRRRTRRGDLRWRRALRLRRGVRPGLFAPRSKLALALEVVPVAGIVGSGLVWGGARLDGWDGRITTAFCAVGVPVLARTLYHELRRPVLVAITSEGVVTDRRALPWERIASVHRDKDGVRLRLRDQVPPVTVGGEDCAVSDERLADVIEYYLATPHRRSALDVNAPGPLGAVR